MKPQALVLGVVGAVGWLGWSLAGCSGNGSGAPASVDAAPEVSVPDAPSEAAPPDGPPADAGRTRPYALASGGVQILVTGPASGLQITPANLADDVDVIEVHQEIYGVPWDAFAAGTSPPPEWKQVMDQIAATAKAANKPVFLSITMLNGGRDSIAARTIVQNGTVSGQDHWAAPCYDFATAPDGASLTQAYLRYVDWMIAEFSPDWLNMAVEVNLYLEKCPAAVAGTVAVANAAYDEAKARQGGLAVFPSIQIDHLYGYSKDSCPDPSQQSACFDRAYAQIAPLKRDRFAMSTYPIGDSLGGPANLPADWFTRGAARGGERPLVAETGWDSTSIVLLPRGGACLTALTATEADSATYLGRVLDDAQAANMDLVNWWSDRDLIPAQLMTDCPCTYDASWCAVWSAFRGPATDGGTDTQLYGEFMLKAFGTMGLRAYDGTPKPSVYARWQAARAIPLQP